MQPIRSALQWVSGGRRRRRGGVTLGGTLVAGIFGVLPNAGLWLPVDVVGVVLGVLITTLGVAATAETEKDLREVATDAAQDARLALADAISPVLSRLGELTRQSHGSTNVPTHRESIIIGVVGALANVIGPERSRACFFDLVDKGGGVRELRPRPAAYVGRARAPSTVFSAGTAAGDAALKMVDENGHLFVSNVDETPPPGWVGEHEYKSFISVAVRFGPRGLGMLTIDAVEPNVLTEASDLPATQILARILAIALAY